MANELKAMRGQLRQIAKEILPEVLAAELLLSLKKNKLLG